MNLEPTGERMVEAFYQESAGNYLIYIFHVVTYSFARKWIDRKVVLDFGCGSGYGTKMISANADHVIGVDISGDAVEFAKENYGAPNLDFLKIEPVENALLPFASDSFDVVLSFQVIEHVGNVDSYLAEIHRVLKPGGVFLCATPDRSTRLFPKQKPWNMWHLHEYEGQELVRVMESRFCDVELFRMGGRKPVLDIEISRTRRLSWIMLPVTLPFVPEAVRIGAISTIKKLARLMSPTKKSRPSPFNFSVDDVYIAKAASPSVNLITVAAKQNTAAECLG